MISGKYCLFDKTHFGVAKGMGIFVVVLVHLCNRYLDFPYLSPIAGAAVSVFLLCSGYGLSESYKKKELKDYWTNKLVKIWIPSFLSISLFSVIQDAGFIVWFTEYPLFLYGWYLQVLFFDYLLFWIIYRLITPKWRIGLIFVVSTIAFLCIRSQLYAEQLLCFPIGIAVSELNTKKKIGLFSNRSYVILFSILGILLTGAFLLRNTFEHYLLFNLVWHVFKTSAAIAVILAVYVFRRLTVLKIFVPLGTISYSLYLLNNHTLSVLKGIEIRAGNLVSALLLTIVSSWVFTMICDQVYLLYNNLRAKR